MTNEQFVHWLYGYLGRAELGDGLSERETRLIYAHLTETIRLQGAPQVATPAAHEGAGPFVSELERGGKPGPNLRASGRKAGP